MTGDMCPLLDVEESLAQGSSDVFGDLLPDMLSKDLSVTNLELPLTNGNDPIHKVGPNLKASPGIMKGLANSGFDVFALANNHTRDFGDDALIETMQAIEKNGLKHVGAGQNLEFAQKPLRLEINGVKISCISFSMSSFSDATENSPGVGLLNPARNAVDIFNEKKENNLVFVFSHDGRMHIPVPSERVIENYKAFVDAGADIVVGHHPHIYQGYEYYNGSAIFYSLGNFLFPPINDTNPKKQKDWCLTYSIKAHFDKCGITKCEIIPHIFDVEARRLSKLKEAEKEDFFKDLDRLNKLLKNRKENYKLFQEKSLEFKYYDNVLREYAYAVESSTGKEKLKHAAERFYRHLKTEEHIDVFLAVSESRSCD
jgi:poly-gamma-glutamate synthesis protein (capsule biosynthesis protein)